MPARRRRQRRCRAARGDLKARQRGVAALGVRLSDRDLLSAVVQEPHPARCARRQRHVERLGRLPRSVVGDDDVDGPRVGRLRLAARRRRTVPVETRVAHQHIADPPHVLFGRRAAFEVAESHIDRRAHHQGPILVAGKMDYRDRRPIRLLLSGVGQRASQRRTLRHGRVTAQLEPILRHDSPRLLRRRNRHKQTRPDSNDTRQAHGKNPPPPLSPHCHHRLQNNSKIS